MYGEYDVDATFHIPGLDSAEIATKEVAESNVAPAINQAPIETSPTPSVPITQVAPIQTTTTAPIVQVAPIQATTTTPTVQATPVQNVPTYSFVPVQYITEPTYDDKKLFQELSAVSDEVLKCRNRALNDVL